MKPPSRTSLRTDNKVKLVTQRKRLAPPFKGKVSKKVKSSTIVSNSYEKDLMVIDALI